MAFAVPRPTVVCAVASNRPGETVMLRFDRQVRVSLEPLLKATLEAIAHGHPASKLDQLLACAFISASR